MEYKGKKPAGIDKISGVIYNEKNALQGIAGMTGTSVENQCILIEQNNKLIAQNERIIELLEYSARLAHIAAGGNGE